MGIHKLASIAKRCPQAAYAGMVYSLQAQWQYLQCMTPETADSSADIDTVLTNVFLPALFGETDYAVPREQLLLPVRQAALGLPLATHTAMDNFLASDVATAKLSRSLLHDEMLDMGGYLKSARETCSLTRAAHAETATYTLMDIGANASAPQLRQLTRAQETDAWLTTMHSTLNGTALSKDKFLDSIHLQFSLQSLGLSRQCDG